MLKNLLKKAFPNFWYFYKYYIGFEKTKDMTSVREEFFSKLIKKSKNKKRCLQVGVRNRKYGENWESVDLYDESEYIDYNYDIHDLKFKNNTFDIIVCNAILEHVENPIKAVSELYRVLKENGEIWIEIPFNQPYHPSPNDYWRFSPEGIDILMSAFKKQKSGIFKINKSYIYNGVFFYGRKINRK